MAGNPAARAPAPLRPVQLLVLLVLLLAAKAGARLACEEYADPENVATVQSKKLSEASGIVSSRENPGVLWSHEDSGKHPELYAVSVLPGTMGKIVAKVDLKKVTARHQQRPDFEDVARSRCPHLPDRDCIWAGDIGSNCARLQSNGFPYSLECGDSFYLIAVPEPTITDHGDYAKIDAKDVFEVEVAYPHTGSYPNIPMDSEALVVHPNGTKAWLIEKRHGLYWDYRGTPARIYETPQDLRNIPSRAKVQLKLAATVNNPDGWKITGADLHPTGMEMVVRAGDEGGTWAYKFREPFDFSTIELHGKVASNSLHQPQPEAVAYDFTGIEIGQAGKALWHISEQGEGYQPLEYVRCSEDGTEEQSGEELEVKNLGGTFRSVDSRGRL